jgi:hypothetical protein
MEQQHKRLFEDLQKSFTAFQKEIHFPKLPSDPKADDPSNVVNSVYRATFKKASWVYPVLARMENVASTVTPSGGEESSQETYVITYRAKTYPYHGLSYSYLTQRLPAIIFKEEFEGRWCRRPGINIIEEAELFFNNTSIQTFDNKFLNDYVQFFMYYDSERERNQRLGDISYLQAWSNKLPTHTTTFDIPWFYSTDESNFFPLFRCTVMDKLEHRLVLKRNFSELLSVREKATKKLVPFNSSQVTIKGYDMVPGAPCPQLPTPEMYGYYFFLTDSELEYNHCSNTVTTYPVDSVVTLTAEKLASVGDTVTIDFRLQPYATHTLLWSAENERAILEQSYSNYTTDAEDPESGYSPIKMANLTNKYGATFDLGRIHTETAMPLHHCRHVAFENGYNCYTFASRAHDFFVKPGVNLSEAKLTVKLQDMNPFCELGELPTKDRFLVRVSLIQSRQLEFVEFATNEKERTGSKTGCIRILGSD